MAQVDIHTVLQPMVDTEPATQNLNLASRLWSATCVKHPTLSISMLTLPSFAASLVHCQ
jgi:hypothetical protein